MNSFELNKILGAILFAVLVVTLVRLGTEMLFAPPSTEGLPAPEVQAQTQTKKSSEPKVPLATLIKQATLEQGKRVSKKCVSCHSFNKGGKNQIGPNLWNIVNRQKANVSGFNYSAALKKQKDIWNYEALDAFLHKPRQYARGTLMSFAGLRKPKDRAAILLYLRSLADKPARLPK